MGRVINYTPAQLEPATPRQRRTIALLCMGLKIKEPLEEKPMTIIEAGRLVRELSALKKAERRRKK